jgi:hypothetical protein
MPSAKRLSWKIEYITAMSGDYIAELYKWRGYNHWCWRVSSPSDYLHLHSFAGTAETLTAAKRAAERAMEIAVRKKRVRR